MSIVTSTRMKKTNRKSRFYPDYIARSVLEIKADELKEAGITHLVFDIDETIVPRNHHELDEHYIVFLQKLEKQGFTLLIGSNSRRDISNITRHMSAEIVRPTRFSFKPLSHYYRKIIFASQTDVSNIVMIGDKILNDVVGGNIAGLTTILVEPYAQKRGIFHRTYLKYALRKS